MLGELADVLCGYGEWDFTSCADWTSEPGPAQFQYTLEVREQHLEFLSRADRTLTHSLEEMPEEIAFAEPAMAVLREDRMVGHPLRQVAPAEPPTGQIQVNLRAQPAI